MITSKNTLWLFMLALCFVLVSCGDDSKDPSPVKKSNAKAITSFKLSSLNPEVTGTITEAEKKITLSVPHGTDVTALTPTVVVSDKASVTPGSGTAANFTNPVVYSVTAEDGSKQNYTVTVTVRAIDEETITIDALQETAIEQHGVLTIEGSNFGDPSTIKVILRETGADNEIEVEATSNSTNSILYFEIPSDFPVGVYEITLHIGDESFDLDETITITSPKPTISNVDKTVVASGETLVITGNHFAESGNEVRFEADGFSFGAEIVSESATSIEVIVPETLSDGAHRLLIIVNDVEVEYNELITIGEPSLEPIVSSINKTTFNRGETIIITGEHLNSQDVSTYLYFWPVNGLAFQRLVSVSEDGTEISYTIPEDFTPGEYELEVYVNFEMVDYVVDITIN